MTYVKYLACGRSEIISSKAFFPPLLIYSFNRVFVLCLFFSTVLPRLSSARSMELKAAVYFSQFVLGVVYYQGRVGSVEQETEQQMALS